MKKKIFCLLFATVMLLGSMLLLASCGEEEEPPEETVCTEHVDDDNDGYCDECDEQIDSSDVCVHVDIDGDKICDECGHDMTQKQEMKPLWESANIIMQLNLSDNNQELSSELVRYVEGSGDYNTRVDQAVARRNIAATDKTKVTVTYKYWDNLPENNWSETIQHIEDMVTSTTIKDAPDVYSTFIYDLVGASVKGHFANLKGTTRGKGTNLEGLNYFEFVYDKANYESEYELTGEDRGFMYEWMESVTLDPYNRMYVLASDYYIDMVRAFFMIPVNISILEDIANNEDYIDITGDRDDDGDIDIDDFYAQVTAGEWTYSLMKAYSEAAYIEDTDGTTGEWLGDERIGFAMSTGGVAVSGIIYTSSISVIDKVWNNATNDWDYSYPTADEVDDIQTLTNAIYDLLETDGVVFVPDTSATSGTTSIAQFGESHLKAIRQRFSTGDVLFGDIMMVGALEFSAYQDMGENAFGVVPVPIYRENNFDEDGNVIDKYLTQIHNVGRPGAIAYNTKKFVECTAFLNYQSTNSSDILNSYYTYNLCYTAAGGAAGTVKMLDYLRKNVRTSFDKAMEDAMGEYDEGVKEYKVTNLLTADGRDFNVPNLREVYGAVYDLKAESLVTLTNYFKNAAD